MGGYFGLTADEVSVLPETAVSGGVEKIWRSWQGFLSSQIELIAAEFDAEKKRSESGRQDDVSVASDPEKWACRRAILPQRRAEAISEVEAMRGEAPPLWRMISGLEGNERAMSPGERAAGIRKLLKGVERVARTELRAEEVARGGDWRKVPQMVDSGEAEDGRCFAWDPLRSICFYFGIARTKLGAYAWELWGLSATQLVDRVKCEAVRGKIRAEMQKFARDFVKNFSGEGDAVEEAWKAFRGSRGGAAYRASLAAKFGYSSYAKFSRACLMCYGMEPSELERVELEEAVLEILTEPGVVGETVEQTRSAEVERERMEGGRQEAEGGGGRMRIGGAE